MSTVHTLLTQLASFRQSRSAQSIAPSPSSSTPLLHTSGILLEPVEIVTVETPCVPGYDCTITRYVPAGSAWNVCVAFAICPALRQKTRFWSHAWLTPARKSDTTCAEPC